MLVTTHNIKPSKKPEVTARDIDQRILNRQRKADMCRQSASHKPVKLESMTAEFFEGLELV